VRRAQAAGLSWPLPAILDEAALERIRMKLSINSRCKFNSFVLLAQALPQ
jgi:hypothetical protein